MIDLRNIVAGKLDFIGDDGFSRNGTAELRVVHNGSVTGVAADTNGNGVADLEIFVNRVGLTSSNFLL